jgi:hypothetical protein
MPTASRLIKTNSVQANVILDFFRFKTKLRYTPSFQKGYILTKDDLGSDHVLVFMPLPPNFV